MRVAALERKVWRLSPAEAWISWRTRSATRL